MSEPGTSGLHESRLLLIDDNPANTMLLEQILRRAGYTGITVCNDSREVALLLDATSPDLILVDLHMPHLDGFRVLELAQAHADGRFLPVIVLTADTTKESANRALQMGAHDLISKPFDLTEIQLRVRNSLRTRMAYQELRRHNSQLRDYVDALELDADLQLDSWDTRRARIEGVLRENAPRMVFQPIVDLHANANVGFEALARFDAEPHRSPDRWFHEASTVGLGFELELRALRNAVASVPSLQPGQFLSVNMSPSAILGDACQQVGHQTAWDRVVIELTEHTNIDDYTSILHALQPLREMGARLSVDDAGAGYASLRHILHLAPDFIKLDISICRGIHSDPARRALASAMVTFARDTQSTLIAEGIESEQEREVLIELGIGFGQGFLLGRPGTIPDSTLCQGV